MILAVVNNVIVMVIRKIGSMDSTIMLYCVIAMVIRESGTISINIINESQSCIKLKRGRSIRMKLLLLYTRLKAFFS